MKATGSIQNIGFSNLKSGREKSNEKCLEKYKCLLKVYGFDMGMKNAKTKQLHVMKNVKAAGIQFWIIIYGKIENQIRSAHT